MRIRESFSKFQNLDKFVWFKKKEALTEAFVTFLFWILKKKKFKSSLFWIKQMLTKDGQFQDNLFLMEPIEAWLSYLLLVFCLNFNKSYDKIPCFSLSLSRLREKHWLDKCVVSRKPKHSRIFENNKKKLWLLTLPTLLLTLPRRDIDIVYDLLKWKTKLFVTCMPNSNFSLWFISFYHDFHLLLVHVCMTISPQSFYRFFLLCVVKLSFHMHLIFEKSKPTSYDYFVAKGWMVLMRSFWRYEKALKLLRYLVL